MKRMLPIVIDVIRENKSNDPDVIAKNLKIKVHYRTLPKALKGLLIKTPFTKDVVINSRIDVNHKKIALAHELGHIKHDDFHSEKHINLIERIAHDRELDEDIDEEFFYHVVNSKDV